MQKKTPQQEGREFESRFVKKRGGRKQPGSGNTPFYKLDIDATRLLLSLKWTEKKSFPVTASDMQEVVDAVYGLGGLGGEYTPALVFELEGDEYVTLKFDDLAKLIQEEIKVFKPSKNAEKTARADSISLLNKEGEIFEN